MICFHASYFHSFIYSVHLSRNFLGVLPPPLRETAASTVALNTSLLLMAATMVCQVIVVPAQSLSYIVDSAAYIFCVTNKSRTVLNNV